MASLLWFILVLLIIVVCSQQITYQTVIQPYFRPSHFIASPQEVPQIQIQAPSLTTTIIYAVPPPPPPKVIHHQHIHFHHRLPPPQINPFLVQQFHIPPQQIVLKQQIADGPQQHRPPESVGANVITHIENNVYREHQIHTVFDISFIPSHIAKVASSFRLGGPGLHIRVFTLRKKTSGSYPYRLNLNQWCYCKVMTQCDCSTPIGRKSVKKELHSSQELVPFDKPLSENIDKKSMNVIPKKEILEGPTTKAAAKTSLNELSIQPNHSVEPPIRKYEYEYDLAHSRRFDSPFLSLSDPLRLGLAWCWQLRRPIRASYNWAWLTKFEDCKSKKMDGSGSYFQVSFHSTVCVDTGGIELQFEIFDEAAPFKTSCIPRNTAMASDEDSCWNITTMKLDGHPSERYIYLQRTAAAQCKAINTPFENARFVASRFAANEGGISHLHHCNGGHYTGATILIVPSPENIPNPLNLPAFQISEKQFRPPMLELIACDPPNPIPKFACKGVGHQCLNTLRHATLKKHVS